MLPCFFAITGTSCAMSIILIFTPGELARSVTAAVGRPPTQKKASILRSLSAFTDSATPSRPRPAAPLALHVLVLVQPRGFDDAEREHFGRAAARSGGHALAFHVCDLRDPGALDRHDVHAVRVEHRERTHRNRLA